MNAIILGALQQKASDIHLEPFEKKLVLRYRVDGTLRANVALLSATCPVILRMHPNKGARMTPPVQRGLCRAAAVLTLAAVSAASARAQGSSAATPAPGPAIGSSAPDFALPGATRYGLLRDSVRLSNFRGQTVVIAFFYKARTKG